jgi:NADH:ubiquinone oxidoreductase subunit F (NADH-binding)/(2Fe-2S) ferredoxin/Pyruvate/2-oxoacid:ferredoxin oxidoreductase delta subunit
MKIKSVKELSALREECKKEFARPKLRICCGTGCCAAGAMDVAKRAEELKEKLGLQREIVKTGCQGLCERGPLMIIEPEGLFYQHVTESGIGRIMEKLSGKLSYTGDFLAREAFGKTFSHMEDVPFYRKQKRVILKRCGRIDPCNIYHYIAEDGYKALEKVLSEMSPEEVIDEVKRSGLRGRGGAGFPAGRKWEAGRKARGDVKYVICNGDEGDPGAFMDRSILEGDPHSVLEGMLICGYAIGAKEGFIYVRAEYPLACKNVKVAIKQAEELGLLGENILGSGLSFHIEVKEGAGAFVCGESTALTLSIEGERGMPKSAPRARTTEEGLFGKPTVLNNVETFANIAFIINEGASFYRTIGTEGSPGTKIFALTGKVKNTGLIEVPMGITVGEIVFDIGGGIIGDRRFKAVQTGGPSGGCIPEDLLHLPVDFDTLQEAGSMMGSGGFVVMDEDTCMVEVARFFLSFIQNESCGKCSPCRIGTAQMLHILERITNGEGREGDIELLLELGEMIQKTSTCGLGQTAPNPVLSTIKYFRKEYQMHIEEKWCPAKVCRGCGRVEINERECILCGICKEVCAEDAIVEERGRFYIDQKYCTKCRACFFLCPIGAICIERESARERV